MKHIFQVTKKGDTFIFPYVLVHSEQSFTSKISTDNLKKFHITFIDCLLVT